MFNDQFYHELLRKYVIVFGNLFNNIYINRKNAAGDIQQTLKVPLNYGPRDKALSLLDQKPDFVPQNAISLPRMSFEQISMNYAPQRKLTTVGKRYQVTGTDASRMKYTYNPVPYDINMALSIMVKNADDGAQILEQILPYFTPEFTVSIKPVADMDMVQDIPIVLQGVTTEDTYEGNYEQRRALIHTLDFIVKGNFYGPVRNQEIIKSVQVDFLAASGAGPVTSRDVANTPRNSRITITPVTGGTAATATANIHSNGVLNDVTISTVGDNYANLGATVTFSSPQLRTDAVSLLGPSAPLPKGNPGFPYSNGIATTSGGDGSGLTLNITTTNTGLISAASINFSGSGYQAGNVLTARQPGASNSVFFVVISVETQGGSSNTATGVPVFNANNDSVIDVTITNSGNGYSTAPTVTISEPIGTKTLAQIEANDNFGFGITRTFFQDGKKYNPVNDEDEPIS